MAHNRLRADMASASIIRSVGRFAWVAAVIVSCTLFFLVPTTGSQPEASKDKVFFLVATPELPDPFFGESVVLMLPPKQPPLVVGLIVNKPTKMVMRKLFPDSSALKSSTDRAYFGGPVEVREPAIVVRARRPITEAIHLADDVYVSLEVQSVLGQLKKGQFSGDLRIFLGRAQWSLGQLRGEMARGSWYAVPAEPSLIFSTDPKGLWRTLVARANVRKVRATRAWGSGPLPILLEPGLGPWPPQSALP